ncbi:hypothetical protein, conserved [Trypanosoma brucei gambiense DAL972]|uniref:Uncharacterized protein n=2 Tax=Trypanosoma brucei TaxID=5691 RepID=D0A630_TRYB9|nr:hypothetical protein, conserved [Trypanosoma brucei gambiense DAL972]RHW68403.1 hypothetical protein DPX39_110028700 [Trypanosoma brucei equiperdum]CBH17131.1 hypothetical protein, conserved [Trypanosoma brucei gambiense DAL972]|eukprot:XP_011779395.1 hypothetical protein, conserved [Trypanosoma brucei gambiense DAL972]
MYNNDSAAGGDALQETCVDAITNMARRLDPQALTKVTQSLQDMLEENRQQVANRRGRGGYQQHQHHQQPHHFGHRGNARPPHANRQWGSNNNSRNYYQSSNGYDNGKYQRGGRPHQHNDWNASSRRHQSRGGGRDYGNRDEERVSNTNRDHSNRDGDRSPVAGNRSPPRGHREGAGARSSGPHNSKVEEENERGATEKPCEGGNERPHHGRHWGGGRGAGRVRRGERRPNGHNDAKAGGPS